MVILGYNWVRLPDAALDDLCFSKICFVKTEAMNIGLGQITDALFNFFAMKKGPYLYLPDAALSFYNNWSHL